MDSGLLSRLPLGRYSFALALAGLALLIRGALPVETGTTIYQLPLAAVLVAGWFGGRGPGLFALLICAAGILYWFIPPADSFNLPPDYAVGFGIFICLGLLLTEFSGVRRRVEQALRASEERFRALVQFSFNVWYWETDAQHRFTRLDLSGWPSDAPAFPSAQIGKTRWEHPYVNLDEQGWREHRATIDAHLPFRDFERAIPTADGGRCYHAVSGLPVFDEAGRFVGYRGVGRDITERKRAEAEHRAHVWFLESLARIHRVIQGANDLETMINAVLGEVRDIFQSDRAVFSIFGTRKGTLWYRRLAIKLRPGCEHRDKVGVEYVADEDATAMRSEVRAAGRPVALVLGSVSPHVARSHAHFGAQSALSMAIEGRHAGLEYEDFYSFTLDECSRRRVWTAEEMRLFEEIGRRLGDVLTKLSTLGDLQRRDAYLSEAQRLSQSASWAWNAASNGFVHWSKGRLSLLGSDSGQFPTLEEVRQSIHPEDRDAWSERFAQAIRERSRFELEYRSLLPDGSVKHFRAVAHPVLDGSGGLLEFVGTVIDITAEKRAEAEHRAHVWFLESMDRMNRAMQGTNEVEQMMSGVLDTVLEVFACDRAWLVYPCDPDAPSWRAVMEHTRPEFPGAFAQRRDVPMTAAAAKVVRTVLGSDGAVPAGPGHERSVESETAEQFGVRSQMLMALHPKGDRPYLFGVHQCSRPRSWTKDEQRLFEDIGHRLTDALSSLIAFRSLRESEGRLERAQSVAHVGWWERDYQTGRVSLSDEACRIFGVQPVDLPHWHDRWVSLIHPEDRQRTAEASEIALRGGPRYDIEYRVVRPDGTVCVVHSQGDVSRDEMGRPIRQFGVMQDITELRRAEAALRESEHRYRILFEKANDAIFLENEGDEIIEVNERACTLLGYSRDELLNMRVPDLQAPEARGQAGRVIREEIEEHGNATFQSVDLHRSGRRIPVEVTNTGISDRGVNVILSVVRDITERKRAEDELRESEARFRTFVDHATDAFFLIDEQLNVVIDVNRQACESLGYSREELIRMHPRDFDVGLDEPAIAGLAERAARHRITFETRHRRKDGTVFPVEIRSGTFKQAGKLFYLALVRDISERKVAEETLRRQDNALQIARSELARVSRLTTLGELTTSIAHEVSQPLGAMTASAGACARWLAAEPPDIAEARLALDNIVADGKRARQVIARIRAMTKRQPPRAEELDINQKILDVLALTGQELRSHDIVVRTKLDTTLPSVTGDRVQLQQVLLNLIMNAIEAMSSIHDRARELTIVSGRDGDNPVVVEVRDSGTGLDPGHAEHVFEAFHTTKAEGLGIGLSISRSIVEAHGGRLWASSNEPHGAVFRFSLPVSESE